VNALRRELAIKTTILRLVIAVQFSMLAPKVVYTQRPASAAPDGRGKSGAREEGLESCLRSSSRYRAVVDGPGERRHPAVQKEV